MSSINNIENRIEIKPKVEFQFYAATIIIIANFDHLH